MIALISAGQLGIVRVGAFIPPFELTWGSITGGTLSNSDKTATQTASTTEMRVMSTSVIPKTGKWYAEIGASDSSGAGGFVMAFGIATALTGGTFAAARSTGSSEFVSAGITAATQATFSPGRIMLAIDYPSKKIWVGRDGTWFSSGDPAADSNPYYADVPEGDWRLFMHADNDNNGTGYGTLHLVSGATLYSPPSGFARLA